MLQVDSRPSSDFVNGTEGNGEKNEDMMQASSISDKGKIISFRDEQQADATLRHCFKKSKSRYFKKAKNGQ